MKPLKCLLAVAIALVIFQASTQDAKAQCWGRGYGGVGGVGGVGGGYYGYGFARYTPAPYFAVFPPVYYGERVRMNYGDRPFAISPYRIAREWGYARNYERHTGGQRQAAAGPSEMILNPHVQSRDDDQASRTYAKRPNIIENPYVDQEVAPLPGRLIRVAKVTEVR